jgi:hypothetical protein
MPLESIVIYSGDVPILDLKGTVLQSENHTAENEVVEQVLENGSPMADHIIIKPDILEISFIVTNLDVTASSNILGAENAKTVWNELKRLRNTRALIDVLTTHENYTSMAIESLTSSHEAPFKGQLKYNIKLKKVDLTNFNVGNNTPDKYIGKNGKETNPNANVAKSATDPSNYGFSMPDNKASNPDAVAAVVKEYTDNYYTDLIEDTTEAYTVAKAALEETAKVVKIVDNEVFEIMTNVNDSVMKFRIYYNEELGCWMMDILDVDNEISLTGIVLFYGTNLVDGLNIDLSMNNLFMSNQILKGGVTNRYIYWFDGDEFNSFKEIADGLYGTKALNFSLSEMDYDVTVEPVS